MNDEPSSPPQVRHRHQCLPELSDPRDDKFLEAAVHGRSGILITGDADLLALHPFQGVAILTPPDFLRP
jgi:predicted nucleic acid-binding protein